MKMKNWNGKNGKWNGNMYFAVPAYYMKKRIPSLGENTKNVKYPLKDKNKLNINRVMRSWCVCRSLPFQMGQR